MSEPTVRAAEPADVDAILDLAARAWHATYGDVLREETIESALAEWYDREWTREAIELHALSANEVGTSFYRALGFEAVQQEPTELFGEETTETLFRRPVER